MNKPSPLLTISLIDTTQLPSSIIIDMVINKPPLSPLPHRSPLPQTPLLLLHLLLPPPPQQLLCFQKSKPGTGFLHPAKVTNQFMDTTD